MIREIHVHITFGVKAIRGAMTVGLLAALSAPLGSESITLTTYYPAPVGIYQKMTTTNQTTLARDIGNVTIGTVSHLANLDVTGTAGVKNLQVNGLAVAGAACSPNGLVARDAAGLLLSCQTLSWKTATGGGVNTGGYTFHLSGHTNWLLYGTGTYDSATGKFYGDIICDPVTVGPLCGGGGSIWCGADAVCAWNYLASYNNYYAYYKDVVRASALPIIDVTRKW